MAAFSAGAQLRPAGRSLAVALSPGDLLFDGDTILTADGDAAVALCAPRGVFNLSKAGEYTITPKGIRSIRGSAAATAQLAACDLPELDAASTRSIRELARGSGVALPALDQDANLAADPAKLGELMSSVRDLPAVKRRGLIQGAASIVRDQSVTTEELPLGPAYALVVGISKYERLRKEEWLEFAHTDAQKFAEFLASPRGGEIEPRSRMRVLTNEEATKDAIREYVQLYLEKAKQDRGTFILVLAAHGVLDDQTDSATIVTHESNPEDLYTSGIPMDELQEILSSGLAGIGRMLVYVDVCHSAKIGSIKTKNVNRAVQSEMLPRGPGRVLSLVSSGETESSWEGENWGGGHGAFTYFLLRGLNGDGDADGDGVVNARELIEYVQGMVKRSTRDQQHPVAQSLTMGNTAVLADKTKSGLTTLSDQWRELTEQQIKQKGSGRRGAQDFPAPFPGQIRQDLADFDAALRNGRLLPGEAGSAFDILRNRLQGTLAAADYRIAETDLRVALENRGQAVILRYLEGDQVQQQAASFRDAGAYFQAAGLLAPDSAAIESRQFFSIGRELIFSRQYDEAVRYLERAASIDPQGAYSYNALGIAYLEQGQRDAGKLFLAVAAFEDAIRLAPRWVYPRHNLALAYAEQGQYDPAIRAYREAMRLGPDYSYLAYNLGLLYQRTNRLVEAERSYREALSIAERARSSGLRPAVAGEWQEGADILTALGTVEAARGGRRNRVRAERYYRDALAADARSRPARHNLALLLAGSGPSVEAEGLWRQNLDEDPQDTAARLAFADYLDRTGRTAEAVAEYVAAIGESAFPGVRRKLAAVYLKTDRAADARAVLERALAAAPGSPGVLEDLGDVELRAGDRSAALRRYQEAEQRYSAGPDRNRVRQKRKRIE